MNLILETERLLLRPLVLSDADEMFAMDNQAKVHKYLWQSPTQTVEETIKIIEMVQKQYHFRLMNFQLTLSLTQ
jgi:RimJ/RimL family protein N-acetyltransferase